MAELPNIQSTSQVLHGYAFVANVSQLIDASSYTLAPSCDFRRAKQTEINELREYLKFLSPAPSQFYTNLWEYRLPFQGNLVNLPEQEWRYFVIDFVGSNATINGLQDAFNIAPLELEIIFTISHLDNIKTGAPALIWNNLKMFQIFHAAKNDESFFQNVMVSDLEAVKDIYDMMQRYDHSLIDMNQVVRKFDDIKAIPRNAPLSFLGYFAILESLLTHSPKPSDPSDSITRQVIQKIALLENRWSPKLDYAPFGEKPPKKIWTEMYSVRSALAHGGEPDFKKKFKALLNYTEALRLVKECSKSVARYALKEPQLLLDLKNC